MGEPTVIDRHKPLEVVASDSPLKLKLPGNRGVFRIRAVDRERNPVADEPWKIVRAQDPKKVIADGTTGRGGEIEPSGEFDVNDYLLRIADQHYLVPKRHVVSPVASGAAPQIVTVINRPDEKPRFDLLSPFYTHPRGGRQFQEEINQLAAYPDPARPDVRNRDHAIKEEVLINGNTPSWTESWKEVRLTRAGAMFGIEDVLGKVWVMPDYLSIGSDDDFVRIPMSAFVAQEIADALRLVLPTELITAAIYQQADIKLVGRGISPSGVTEQYGGARICHHNDLINGELNHPRCQWHRDLQKKNGKHYSELWDESHVKAYSVKGKNGTVGKQLIAGHKKDVIALFDGRDLLGRRGLGFGGLYDASGKEQQRFYDSPGPHTAGYFDYSHGVRYVWPLMSIDGALRPIKEILRTPKLVALLSTVGQPVPQSQPLEYAPRVPGHGYG